MDHLLFLAHRIPYPPNKGDKIRSYHWLRSLANKYRIHLGTFVDDPHDRRHASTVEQMCEDVCLVEIQPTTRKLLSLVGLVSGEALSLPYYRSRKLQSWVNQKVRDLNLTCAVAFSSPMALYLMDGDVHFPRFVVDFVDVDSEKWRQYANRHRWPMRWLYRREADALLQFEGRASAAADTTVFVSQEEVDLYHRLDSEATGRVVWVRNGVDLDFFSSHQHYENPYLPGDRVLVFTGAMDYWANVDAVCWFAKEIFPGIQRRVDQARFYIVGARPTESVQQLAEQSGVVVTGRVEDVRPYIAHAKAAAAPLRLARGIQNKVLEAMAMGRPVLATHAAVEGIDIADAMRRYVDDASEVLVERGVELLELDSENAARLGQRERRHVEENYDWHRAMKEMSDLVGGLPVSTAAASVPLPSESVNG